MILGIESSCDESAISVLNPNFGFIGEWIHTQIDLQENYGGIVPDLASREHLNHFAPLFENVKNVVQLTDIQKIAVTYGPGLAGCLAMGISVAKALSMALDIPLVGVNHLRGHALSPFIGLHKEAPECFDAKFQALLPHLGLLVSGGNTLLFKIDENRKFHLVAQTLDDAAGEALDKGAKLMGMAYPGGPLIETAAYGGNSKYIRFPRAFTGSSELKFSFSGLKTSLRYRLEKMSDEEFEANKQDLCASYQAAVVDQLIARTQHAVQQGVYKSFGLSGGVANNKVLCAAASQLAEKSNLSLCIAEPQYTKDNASMIAFAAYADPEGLLTSDLDTLSFNPSVTLC